MPAHPSSFERDEQVRQVDVCLRARYPDLVTRIFAVGPFGYQIVFDRDLRDASTIQSEFDTSICYMTLVATLSNEVPAHYVREIQPIPECEVGARMAGLPLRRFDIINVLAARFPNLRIADANNDGEHLNLILTEDVTAVARHELLSFAATLGQGMPFRVVVDAGWNGPRPAVPGSDPMMIVAFTLRPHAPGFARRDDAFWFENLSAIADGSLRRDAFPCLERHGSRCFVDATMAQDHINIRQLLMMYDDVFLSPPLAHVQAEFLATQGLSREDVLTCVESGRLRLVMTQPEERLDISLLESVDEIDRSAIMGRRTTAGLLLASVVDAAKDYRLADNGLLRSVRTLAEAIAPLWSLDPDQTVRSMLWPITARREALLNLLDRGSKGGPALRLADTLAIRLQARYSVDLRLETLVLSERVHIGHALGATVFPANNEPPGFEILMAAIAAELNFYQSFNRRLAASWAGDQKRRLEGVTIMPAVPIFDFDESVPMHEFLSDTAWGSTRAGGRALFTRLAELPADSRQSEINKLKTEMRAKGRWNPSKLISFDNADTGIAIASILFSFLYPPIAGIENLASPLIKVMRRSPRIDAVLNQLTEDRLALFGGNQDLEFLSRIDRVASFVTSRVT